MLSVVDFFNRINLIYGTVSEYCNETTCPTMSGGPRYEYLWADGEHYKKPTALPAPKYIEFLMDWTEGQINNETVFPVSTDVPFPKSFTSLCRKILTRLFRVFVHVYIHHFDRIVSIGAVSSKFDIKRYQRIRSNSNCHSQRVRFVSVRICRKRTWIRVTSIFTTSWMNLNWYRPRNWNHYRKWRPMFAKINNKTIYTDSKYWDAKGF